MTDLNRVLETEIGEVVLREATLEDAKKTVQFMNWVTGEVDFHTYGPNDFNIKASDERRLMELFHKKDNCVFLIATFQEEIIAVATLSGGLKSRTAHRGTVGLTVAKRFWRLGIGKNLMEMVLKFSKNSKDLSKLELLVHENNKAAIALYTKLGFETEGIIRRYFLIGNQYYDGIQMGKLIKKEA